MSVDKTKNLVSLINEIKISNFIDSENNNIFSFLQLKVKDSKPNIGFYYNFIEDKKNEMLLLISYTENFENNDRLRIEDVILLDKERNEGLFNFYISHKNEKDFYLNDLYNHITDIKGTKFQNHNTIEYLLSKILMTYSDDYKIKEKAISDFGM